MKRPPSAPPELPGYSYLRHLGGGGFADVFLYDQRALGRKVAVKVLLAGESGPTVRAQFDAESTLMAALSTHPHIVSIYDAAIAADGRPYLIMEYCSRPNLAERYNADRIAVADALNIGVQIGGAVETAHRAGILHRDIKPANVLTTDFNRPALTDFGISVATGEDTGNDLVGMSIPWSPPEMLSDAPDGDQRADVYSLAATVYTLLARRSPYQRPDGSNLAADLINRIQRTPLPPLGRSDVPASLERALSRGMAKNPQARWTTALDFVRALQDVQHEQGWAITPVDVIDENPVAAKAELNPEEEGRTRIRGLVTIHAQAPVETTSAQRAAGGAIGTTPSGGAIGTGPSGGAIGTGPSGGAAAGGSSVERTQLRSDRPAANLFDLDRPAPPAPADTQLRPPPAAEPGAPEQPAGKRWPWMLAAAAGALAAAGVAIALLTGGTSPAALPADHPTAPATTDQAIDLGVPQPDGFSAAHGAGSVMFTWRDPNPQPGDTFQWKRTDTAADTALQSTSTPTVTIKGADACIEVTLVRDNGQYSGPARFCSKGR